jgi:hypothetical protein
MQGCQELFILVVQICAFSAESLNDWFPFRKRRSRGTMKGRVVGIGMFEVDDLGGQRLFHFLRVALPASFEKGVTSELEKKWIFEFLRGCDVDSWLPVTVDGRRVGAVTHQERADLGSAFGSGFVKRGELPQVEGTDIRAVAYQQLRDFEMAVAEKSIKMVYSYKVLECSF